MSHSPTVTSLFLPWLAAMMLSACTPTQEVVFVPSTKSAVELRALQTRVVGGDEATVMRGVVATLHDLGYRITKAEPEAGTISATRLTGLRLAAVVRPRGEQEAAVRANATVLAPGREAQVDDARFYQDNFFGPLAATLGRTMAPAPQEEGLPDAVRPTAEVMPGAEQRTQTQPATGGPETAPR
jgi:hypothetical protein